MEKEKEESSKAEDFLVNWAEEKPPEEFSGDSLADNSQSQNDTEENLDFRTQLPLGYPFMHPTHDATLDTYGDEGSK